jgi:hypothetical protein
MTSLPLELAVSAGMFGLTILIHLLGLMSLLALARLHIEKLRTPWLQLDRLLVPLSLAWGLFLIHGLEVAAYAVLYWGLDTTGTWERAVFISAAAYSTASTPDGSFPHSWRVTVSLEALNGVLLIGWSTAFLFQTLHRILTTEEGHPLQEGAIAPETEDEKREKEALEAAQGP